MTNQREPRPVGNEQTAWVRLLARAKRAENRVRALRAENTKLRAQNGAQQREEEMNK